MKTRYVLSLLCLAACSDDGGGGASSPSGSGGAGAGGGSAAGGNLGGGGTSDAGGAGTGGSAAGGSSSGGGSSGGADGGSDPDAGGDATTTPDAGGDAGFQSPGRWLVYDNDGSKIVDTSSFPLPAPVPLPEGAMPVTWSPDGRYIAYSTLNRRGLVLDMSGESIGVPSSVAQAPVGPGLFEPNIYRWSPDSRSLAISQAWRLTVVDPSDPAPIAAVVDESGREPLWVSDSSALAYATGDNELVVVKIEDHRVISTKTVGPFTYPHTMVASPTRRELAYLSWGQLALVPVVDGVAQEREVIDTGITGEAPSNIRYTPDGSWLVVSFSELASAPGTPDLLFVDRRDPASRQVVRASTVLGVTHPASCEPAPGGRWSFVRWGDSTAGTHGLAVLDHRTVPFTHVSAAHTDTVQRAIWSPLSSTLALEITEGQTRSLAIVDPATPGNRNPMTTRTEAPAEGDTQFTPDGRVLVYLTNRDLTTRVVGGGTAGEPNPVDALVRTFAISRGSDRIAYWRSSGLLPGPTAWVVRLDGALPSAPVPLDDARSQDVGSFSWQP